MGATSSAYSCVEIDGGPTSGTLMVMRMVLVALRVWVQREPVQERMDSRRRSGALERKLEIREGVGSDWAAKRTVWRSSDLATVEMVGSEEASILIAWTMVCRSFLRVGSMKPRLGSWHGWGGSRRNEWF